MIIKRSILSGLAAVAVAAGLAMPAAESASSDGMPDGTWRQSCQKASVGGGTLRARCRRDGGKYEVTSAVIGSCQAFGNRNGKLFCESSEVSSGSVGQWSGSFRNSCREASVDKHGKLQATCLKSNGTYKRSNLQARKCSSRRAGSRDGNLFCESQDGGSTASRWHGSFRDSCRDAASSSNGVLTATCQTANGSWRTTSLSPNQCGSYHAGSRDGNLFCESQDGGSTAGRWDGSFRNSCRDASMNSNGVLSAICQTANGNWRTTSLSPNQCGSYRAGNRDGALACEG